MEGLLLRDIKGEIDRLAPPTLAETWDRCGVEVGDPGARVRKILVALGPTPKAVERAAKIKAQLLLVHHPFFFKPLQSIDLSTPHGKVLQTLIKSEIALISAHTNLDKALGGVNDALASALDLREIKPLGKGEALCKLVVTAPLGYEERLMESLSASGAGAIGDYRDCFFMARGEGTFKPMEGANPFTGEVGSQKRLAETRIEAVIPQALAPSAIKNLRAAHPYEEPAIDLYQLAQKSPFGTLGRVGSLAKAVTLEKFSSSIMKKLGAKGLRYVGDGHATVRKVAVVSGSGASLWREAMESGADALVTGEVGFHAAQDALDAGFSLIEAGHFCTERVILEPLAEKLKKFALEKGAKLSIEVFGEGEPFAFLTA